MPCHNSMRSRNQLLAHTLQLSTVVNLQKTWSYFYFYNSVFISSFVTIPCFVVISNFSSTTTIWMVRIWCNACATCTQQLVTHVTQKKTHQKRFLTLITNFSCMQLICGGKHVSHYTYSWVTRKEYCNECNPMYATLSQFGWSLYVCRMFIFNFNT